MTVTCQNGRLRDQRHDIWRSAEATTRYWRTRLEFESALEWAQRLEVPEGSYHPIVDGSGRIPMVARYREALVKQLLTPAWDAASVKWKQMALARGQHHYTDVKSERIERAIAEDLAFLAAHPVRRDNSCAPARRREFKEAMRRRIRDIAASRDLSEHDIKAVMSLKHQEILRFSDQYGVNIEWLFEGKGRIFEKDQITINPDMTGSEFVAVVRTLPTADQRSIEARIRELVDRRLDEAPAPIPKA